MHRPFHGQKIDWKKEGAEQRIIGEGLTLRTTEWRSGHCSHPAQAAVATSGSCRAATPPGHTPRTRLEGSDPVSVAKSFLQRRFHVGRTETGRRSREGVTSVCSPLVYDRSNLSRANRSFPTSAISGLTRRTVLLTCPRTRLVAPGSWLPSDEVGVFHPLSSSRYSDHIPDSKLPVQSSSTRRAAVFDYYPRVENCFLNDAIFRSKKIFRMLDDIL